MTVIVADSKSRVMVADTLVSYDGLAAYHAPKVWRCNDGALAGAAGDADGCIAFLTWARDGRVGEWDTTKEVWGLVMTPEGEIRVHGGSHLYEVPLGGWMAIGHGAPMAQAARTLGASPKQCVEAAMKVSLCCGGKAQVFRLKK